MSSASPFSPPPWPPRPLEERSAAEEDERAAARNRAGATVLACMAALGVLVSYGSAGLAGLVVSLSVVTSGALLGVALVVPAGPAAHRRRNRPPLSFDAPYPTFRQVSEQLSWARVSPRHYDLATRPLLVRVLATRLADRHGIDLDRRPDAARALVGEDVWWWLDPHRPAERSSQPPGVDERTLARIVDRLEKL